MVNVGKIEINDLVYFKNIKIVQDKDYFNFSLDSVLLPNFVDITKKTKMILDMCTGNAPIPLILSTKTDAKIYAVELQKEVYNLAKETIKRNYVFSACKKNRGSEKQRYPEPLPSSFLDIGESLSAYLQADKNILRIKKNVNVF